MKQFIYTFVNIVLYAISFGKYTFLEGRFSNHVFKNWSKVICHKPLKFISPRTENEIVEIIKKYDKIRVVGAGHSFNRAATTEEILVSLDCYTGLVWKDLENKQVCVRAGMRVRDISELLWKEYGLALIDLPSHDAQSIGGILSTDVHGTGKENGFISQSVPKLKFINGKGEVVECSCEDDDFKAAIGGLGLVGIITEVVLQCVDAFNIEQNVTITTRDFVKKNLVNLIQDNDHVSIYLFPFTDKCQLNIWKKTNSKESFLGDYREFINISFDALFVSSIVAFLTYIKLLPRTISFLMSLKKGSKLVLKSYKGFNRSIYHLHNELEFAVLFENNLNLGEQMIELYESKYHECNIPFNIVELRFTPEHNRSLLSPGHGRRSMFIDVVSNQSNGFRSFYSNVENYIKSIDARPHLGKFCETFSKEDFERLYGNEFAKFKKLIAKHDPKKKFSNSYLDNLFN